MLKKILGHHNKIFCISFQRTGTTSTGIFFKDHGYKVGDWHISAKNKWPDSYFKGDYQSIFNSKSFKNAEMFEDAPWFASDFYKYLFHHFPKSRFILLERDENKWFDSMLSHSSGKVLGNTHSHCVLYNREDDFYSIKDWEKHTYSRDIDNLLPLGDEHRKHYIKIYKNRNREVKNFFSVFSPERLFTGRLEDPNVWQKMGLFFNINVAHKYQVHVNKSSSIDIKIQKSTNLTK